MSKEHDKAQTEQSERKAFTIVDKEQGIFKLWDCIHQKWNRWQIDAEGKPGVLILMQKLEEAGGKLQDKRLSETYRDLPEDEKAKVAKEVSKVAQKQIAIMATYCKNLDPIPELLENKIEFLAASLSDDQDAAKINAFFLIKSATSMTSLGELKGDMEQMMEQMDGLN